MLVESFIFAITENDAMNTSVLIFDIEIQVSLGYTLGADLLAHNLCVFSFARKFQFFKVVGQIHIPSRSSWEFLILDLVLLVVFVFFFFFEQGSSGGLQRGI